MNYDSYTDEEFLRALTPKCEASPIIKALATRLEAAIECVPKDDCIEVSCPVCEADLILNNDVLTT